MTTNINIDASAYVKKTDLPSNLTLYPTTTASDIATYFKLVTEISDPDYDNPAVDVATGAITGSNQLISSLATSAGILTGNPGIFTVSTVGNIRRTSGSGEAEFYFEIYQRNASGTETLIATSNATSSVSNTTYEQFNASALFNNGTFLPTDRIVLKFYGSKVGGGSNPSYQFQFGGSEPVRTIVPVPASVLLDVPIQVGVTEVVGGTSGKVLSNNSGVVGDIAIDTTPTNGSTNLIDSNAVYDGLAAKQDTLQSGTNIKTVLGDSLLGSGDVTIDLDDLSNVDSTGKNTGDVLEWNAVSGKWEAATPSGGGGGTPAGSDGQIQFNDSGSFGADSALHWDNTNKRLGVGATPALTVRLDVRAQGALSTDIAFRVRNSADNGNIFSSLGSSQFIFGTKTTTPEGLALLRHDFGSAQPILTLRNGQYGNLIFQVRDERTTSSASIGSFRINGIINGGESGTNKRFDFGGHGLGSTYGDNANNSVWLNNQGNFGDLTGSSVIAVTSNFYINKSTVKVFKFIPNVGNFGVNVMTLGTSATNTIAIANGTAPSTSPADAIQFYSNDITAGNAAPHFRTENGSIIKLYQQSSAGITTVADLVTILQNVGLLS